MLSRMRDAGLKLKPEKCHLLKTEVNFLSFTISEKGILPSPHNVAKILRFPAQQIRKKFDKYLVWGVITGALSSRTQTECDPS